MSKNALRSRLVKSLPDFLDELALGHAQLLSGGVNRAIEFIDDCGRFTEPGNEPCALKTERQVSLKTGIQEVVGVDGVRANAALDEVLD